MEDLDEYRQKSKMDKYDSGFLMTDFKMDFTTNTVVHGVSKQHFYHLVHKVRLSLISITKWIFLLWIGNRCLAMIKRNDAISIMFKVHC